MFTACSNKGFQMTFPNGWTVSVQWGPMNYCGNKSFDYAWDDSTRQDTWKSPNAEIAAWNEKGIWYEFENDTVKGYADPNEVLEFMNEIAANDA